MTPLHFAYAEGHTELTQYLVEDVKVNTAIQDLDGETAFEQAISVVPSTSDPSMATLTEGLNNIT